MGKNFRTYSPDVAQSDTDLAGLVEPLDAVDRWALGVIDEWDRERSNGLSHFDNQPPSLFQCEKMRIENDHCDNFSPLFSFRFLFFLFCISFTVFDEWHDLHFG